jgi:hypothetical protein
MHTSHARVLLLLLFAGFDYQTEAGAGAADVQFTVPPPLAQQLQQQGRTLLQENSSTNWCFTHDYSNGGPLFVTHDMQPDVSGLSGVQVLATYCALPDRHGLKLSGQQQQQQHNAVAGIQPAAAVRCSVGAGVAVLCGTHPELAPHWLDVCGWSTERPRTGSHHSTAAEQAASASFAGRQASAAAAAAGAGAGNSSRSAQPALAVLDSAVAAGKSSSRALQQQQEQHSTTAAVRGSSRTSDVRIGEALKGCEDVQLAQHTEALRRVLAASQEQRDLFLSCLLFEVLWRA